MSRITFTAEGSYENYLSELEQRDDIDSTAVAVRHCIEVTEESQQRDAELQQRVEELHQENERLQRKLTAANDRHEVMRSGVTSNAISNRSFRRRSAIENRECSQ
ncbi:hypothetical protein [Natrinema soli]|uniref:Uncharacterized protein n=1 Tax=Natrinema soli TaxID=1930624 RepID=A0ABD5SIL7_9EURY|nr:hypothetical protein [Natrinema soli]